MNIEIVGFYQNFDESRKIFGTFHVYLVDLEIDLRGVLVQKKKGKYMVFLPSNLGMDEETKQWIRYPIFSFMDIEKQRELYKIIRQKCLEYLKKNI